MLCERCFRYIHEEEQGARVTLYPDKETPAEHWILCPDCECGLEDFLCVMYKYLTIPEIDRIKLIREKKDQ